MYFSNLLVFLICSICELAMLINFVYVSVIIVFCNGYRKGGGACYVYDVTRVDRLLLCRTTFYFRSTFFDNSDGDLTFRANIFASLPAQSTGLHLSWWSMYML